MDRLIIVGAGDFGREVLQWLLDTPEKERKWEIGGFLDSRSDALAAYDSPYRVLGDPETFEPSKTDRFVCGIGSPRIKLRISETLVSRGARFINLIHRSATVGRTNTLGSGCVLCPGSVVTSDVILGNYVTLNLHSTVGHDVVIGDGATLSPHAAVSGHATLERGVFVGSNATINNSAEVGSFATVGAGSVVLRKVPPGVTVMGVPARKISGF